MTPADNVEALFASIVRERGGLDALSASELAIARALAQALASDPINPATVAALTNLLPPVLKPAVGGHVDLSLLDDSAIEQLEAIVDRATIPGPAPAPDSDAAHIAELLGMNRGLRELCDRTEQRARQCEQSEQMYRRLAMSASSKTAELRQRLDQITASATSREPG